MMSEERYEIRSKIGQGGVGTVYRAFDRQLNREVAIKRILPEGGYAIQEDATRAMLGEAASLTALQHPNLVTIFESGVDDDGPYIVMELLAGYTIREMVEREPLTLDDFREIALQSQEALIAAQDLDLLHLDLKPGNLMVTWLPNGRFQLKIADFGLAHFSSGHSTPVSPRSGTSSFMAPEQFEQTTVDKRTDMYAIGCLYYYCLSGQYPFNGESASQVMDAHLQHLVTPLAQLRPDLPGWLCKWVMWHLSRHPTDRPRDARESQKHFLMSENTPADTPNAPDPETPPQTGIPAAPKLQTQALSESEATPTAPLPDHPLEVAPIPAIPEIPAAVPVVKAPEPVTLNTGNGTPPAPQTPENPPVRKGPRLLVGNAVPPAGSPAPNTVGPDSESAPPAVVPTTPVAVPTASKPLLVTGANPAPPANPPAPEETAPVVQPPVAAPPVTATPVSPPAGNPLLVAGSAGVSVATPATPPPVPVAPPAAPVGTPGPPPPPTPGASPQGNAGHPVMALPTRPKGISNAVKGVIAAVLAVSIIIAGLVLKGRHDDNDRIEKINEITANFNDPSNPPKELSLSGAQVDLILSELTSLRASKEGDREVLLQALNISNPTDGTDIDAKIVTAATADSIDSGLRLKLFRLLGFRGAESSLDKLIDYASKTDDPAAGKAALQATRTMVTNENFESLLSIITLSRDSSVKNAAVDTLGSVIRDSHYPDKFSSAIITNFNNSTDEDSKLALLRLAGSAGGDNAAALVDDALKGDNDKMKVAAINAMRSWPDSSQFGNLVNYTGQETNSALRRAGFSALITFLKEGPEITEEERIKFWGDIAAISAGTSEQMQIIHAVVKQPKSWVNGILDTFIANGDTDAVQAGAEDAKEAFEINLKRAQRGKAGSPDDEESDDTE
ncbi:protein kinase [Verrucomicrobiaceae bacterium 227]